MGRISTLDKKLWKHNLTLQKHKVAGISLEPEHPNFFECAKRRSVEYFSSSANALAKSLEVQDKSLNIEQNISAIILRGMAGPSPEERAIQRLRAIAFRLTSMDTRQLPQLVSTIHLQLTECRSLLSSPQNSSSDATTVIHQFKTRISSLLQDRTIEGRWAAVVLVKCTIELGGWEVLHQSAPWVRSMVSILKRSDPPTTKKLCVVTLTRIFNLTHSHSNLVREITTPNLPPFITACMQNLQSQPESIVAHSSLLDSMLQSFSNLLPRHPTIFRPFISQLVKLVSALTKVPAEGNDEIQRNPVITSTWSAAQRVYVLLHSSATKSGMLEDRDSGFMRTIETTRSLLNEQFRESSSQSKLQTGPLHNGHAITSTKTGTRTSPSLDICDCLGLLRQYVLTPGSKSAALQLGHLTSLLHWIGVITTSGLHTGIHSQISRKDWQNLLFEIPAIHLRTMQVVLAVLRRFGKSAYPVADELLFCATKIFSFNQSSVALRSIVYDCLGPLLSMISSSSRTEVTSDLHLLIKTCCGDLLPVDGPKAESNENGRDKKTKGQGKSSINPNAIIGAPEQTKGIEVVYPGLQKAAYQLLPILFCELPADILTPIVRAELERTAVLIGHSEALNESIMNPARGGPSLLPFAVRLDATNTVVESILRPRMPVIRTGHEEVDDTSMEDEDLGQSYDASHFNKGPFTASLSTMNSASNGEVDDSKDGSKPEVPPLANTEAFSFVNTSASGKRALEQNIVDGDSKRTRLSEQFSKSVPLAIGAGAKPDLQSDSIENHPWQIASKMTVIGGTEVDAQDESDDDSDFEVPALVIGTGDEEDDT